jgi:hypothetical protein
VPPEITMASIDASPAPRPSGRARALTPAIGGARQRAAQRALSAIVAALAAEASS